MRSNPSFRGFDDIKASDELRQRLYAATAEGRKQQRNNKYLPIGALGAAAACIAAVAFFVTRTPVMPVTPDVPEAIPTPTASDASGVSAANPTALPPPQINGESFQLLAISPESGEISYLELDGVKAVLPNLGPDYKTEIIDGKEVEVAGGWSCPDLSVSGEDIESVTYTVENELMLYEDPRQWITEDGMPTWIEYSYIVPFSNFSDPHNPTTEEITRELEELRKNGELRDLEHKLFQIQWSKRQGKPPSDDDYYNYGEYELWEKYESVPLDYTQFIIETDVDDYSHVWIILLNPENRIDTPILWEKTVTARPGEIVTYYYSNETFDKMDIKGEYDLTQIRDTIKVEIKFKSGNTKTVYLRVEHDANGVLSLSASEHV